MVRDDYVCTLLNNDQGNHMISLESYSYFLSNHDIKQMAKYSHLGAGRY